MKLKFERPHQIAIAAKCHFKEAKTCFLATIPSSNMCLVGSRNVEYVKEISHRSIKMRNVQITEGC